MTVPSYTIYSNHPRLFFRDTDRTGGLNLLGRTNDAGGWQSIWDNTVIARANTLDGLSASNLVDSNSAESRLMVLAFAGWIENNSGYTDAAIAGAVHMAGLSDSAKPPNKRNRMIGLALVFDICFGDMTTAEKDTVANEILQQADRMGPSSFEMAGHAGNDQMCQAMGMLAIANHVSSSEWQPRLAEALNYWYGETANNGRWRMPEYAYSDGGSEKGSWYTMLGMWGELWMAKLLSNATTDVDPWTEFSGAFSKVWEWILWTMWRGGVDEDYEHEGDTAKTTEPLFHDDMRRVFGILSEEFPTPNSTEGGRHLRWLYDQYDALETASGDDYVWDVINFDKATNTAVAPESGTPVPAKSRLFSPPGMYRYRDDWDYEASTTWRISGQKFYWLNHQHFDVGAVSLRYRDDPLILSPAGYYDTFSSSHHVNAYQRSWLQSGCPIVMDPGQSYDRYSQSTVNDGGQQFKKRLSDNASTPNNPFEMQNDEGGLGWLKTDKFSKIRDDSLAVFISLDARRAYRRYSNSADRANPLEIKYLLVHPSAANGFTESVLLYYARIRKQISASANVYIPWHARGDWSTSGDGASATGYRTEQADGTPGKIWLEVDPGPLGSFDWNLETYGSPDSNGYSNDQFRHPDPAADGTNYKPSSGAGSRHQADIKRSSVFVEKTTHTEEERYVILLMPTAAAASKPSFSWITDNDYYGFTAGTGTYRIHKTQDIATVGGEAPDTTPPAEVTSHVVTARDGALGNTWTDPVDADLDHIEVWYRTSAT